MLKITFLNIESFHFKPVLIIVLFIALLTDCTGDDLFAPTLPPITQSGANTFGCYIDGKLLTPRDGTGTFNVPDRGMRYWGSPPNLNYNEIDVRDFKSGTGGHIDIHIENLRVIGEGSYTINESNCEDDVDAYPTINLRGRWWNEKLQAYKWYCSIEGEGKLNITRYDLENRIVSGTFSCKAVNRDDPSEIIEITQGRFDINWETLPYKTFN